MHLTTITSLALGLLLPTLRVSAQQNQRLCGTLSHPACPKAQICVKPAPNVRCSDPTLSSCPGICAPSCTLTSDTRPCPSGQKCAALPQPSIMQTGYCIEDSDPDEDLTCAGFLGTACPTGFECVDVPGDECDPQDGGADCLGQCKRVEGVSWTLSSRVPIATVY
ncbi:hypothetical protein MMC21_003001 [Puttea exsequens]|nr:hypothetical protein [Puttea exsequens]